MSKLATLKKVLGSQTTDKTVHAQAIWQIILSGESEEERIELLSTALKEIDDVPKNPQNLPNKGISKADWDEMCKTHSEMVNGFLKMAFFKTHNVKDFAKEIFRLVDLFQADPEKTFIYARVLYSQYVPYFELPGTPVHMTDSEFRHNLESAEQQVKLIRYICRLPFDEYTERASMMLQVIDGAGDNKSLRVALLAAGLNLVVKSAIKKATEG